MAPGLVGGVFLDGASGLEPVGFLALSGTAAGLGITACNCAGISTVKSVTSYLLDGIKATTDDLKKFSVLHHHGNEY